MDIFASDGVRLAFVDVRPESGSGDPVILVHGFASNHAVNWVDTLWLKTLTRAGYRVIALDLRGHGASEKLYDPDAYSADVMAGDVARLMDHLDIARADVMGYSMGARITAHLAVSRPDRLRSALLGGIGMNLIDSPGLPPSIAAAMEAPSVADLHDPMQRMFRAFAERTGADRRALAACVRGQRRPLGRDDIASITVPTLIAVGAADTVATGGEALAALIPGARFVDIPGRDHHSAVGDRAHKAAALSFLGERP